MPKDIFQFQAEKGEPRTPEQMQKTIEKLRGMIHETDVLYDQVLLDCLKLREIVKAAYPHAPEEMREDLKSKYKSTLTQLGLEEDEEEG